VRKIHQLIKNTKKNNNIKMLKAIIFMSVLIQASLAYDYFTTWQGKVYDPNGKEFMMRGVNNPHAWFDSFNRNFARNALPAISATGSNIVRVVWEMNAQSGLNLQYLDTILQQAFNNRLVVMLELHDVTGSNNREDLLRCARWFRDNSWLTFKHKRNLLVNIANEWVRLRSKLNNINFKNK
jgi:mannan endo-1,4-beta-mannosidase